MTVKVNDKIQETEVAETMLNEEEQQFEEAGVQEQHLSSEAKKGLLVGGLGLLGTAIAVGVKRHKTKKNEDKPKKGKWGWRNPFYRKDVEESDSNASETKDSEKDQNNSHVKTNKKDKN